MKPRDGYDGKKATKSRDSKLQRPKTVSFRDLSSIWESSSDLNISKQHDSVESFIDSEVKAYKAEWNAQNKRVNFKPESETSKEVIVLEEKDSTTPEEPASSSVSSTCRRREANYGTTPEKPASSLASGSYSRNEGKDNTTPEEPASSSASGSYGRREGSYSKAFEPPESETDDFRWVTKPSKDSSKKPHTMSQKYHYEHMTSYDSSDNEEEEKQAKHRKSKNPQADRSISFLMPEETEDDNENEDIIQEALSQHSRSNKRASIIKQKKPSSQDLLSDANSAEPEQKEGPELKNPRKSSVLHQLFDKKQMKISKGWQRRSFDGLPPSISEVSVIQDAVPDTSELFDMTHGLEQSRNYVLPPLTEHELTRLGAHRMLAGSRRVDVDQSLWPHMSVTLSNLTVSVKSDIKAIFRILSNNLNNVTKVYSARMLNRFLDFSRKFPGDSTVSCMKFTSHCGDIIKTYVHLASLLDDVDQFSFIVMDLAKKHNKLKLTKQDHQAFYFPFTDMLRQYVDSQIVQNGVHFLVCLVSHAMLYESSKMDNKDIDGDVISLQSSRSSKTLRGVNLVNTRKQPTWD